MLSSRGWLRFIDKNKRCLSGQKLLPMPAETLALVVEPVLPLVIRTAECSFDAIDQGAWFECEIKGPRWAYALLLHDPLHIVHIVSNTRTH